jgi:branched-chain amino acid transport system permease protein
VVTLKTASVWLAYLLVMLGLPKIFDSLLAISTLNQMSIAIIFALSYNMLLGQGGMLSFGHAVYFGLGGFLAVHSLNLMEYESANFSIIFVPLIGGFSGLLAAIFIGSFSTHRAGTVFAMISLGIGELVAASALILVGFFGGEAGISGDRTLGPSFLGVEFLQDIDIYYLAVAWVFIASLFMYLFTQTPAGRMANAVRDNPERAEFIGYSARWIRFISFCAAGFFAGIAGGLFALNYEFISAESLNAVSSGRVLLMTYIGGIGYFIGPIIGAIVLTLMNSLLSNYTELWLLYLGIMFLLTVMFLPRGFAGFIMMHQLAWVRGKLKALLMPYLITAIPALLCLLSTIALIEMAHASEQVLDFFGMELSTSSISTWLAVTAIVLTSAYATRRSIDQLRTAWNTVNSANDDENG